MRDFGTSWVPWVVSITLAATALVSPASLAQQGRDAGFQAKVEKPAYRESGPRVLFDEAHHNFHTTAGRYKPFVDLIASDGYRITPNKAEFSEETLAGYDILVIANAMGAEKMSDPAAAGAAFSDAECAVLRKWVERGGSLLLIADHAPLGGAAESLGKRFGVGMSNVFTRDPSSAHPRRKASTIVFSRENKRLADHPITRGRKKSERIDTVVTFTGQSLKCPPDAVSLLTLSKSAVDVANRAGDSPRSAAGRSQGLAMRVGKGRVVVLGEAGMLTAQEVERDGKVTRFGMSFEGCDNRGFAINVMHWLSGLLE